MKVDWIGARGKGSVVVVRIEDLHGESLPSTRRAPIHKARPALAEAAKPFLDSWNQLVLDGVAVRTHVGRIHCVGVIIEGVCVLQLDDEDARKTWRNPLLIELISLLLLDTVVACEMEALTVVRLQVRIRRSGAKTIEAVDKMVVENQQREVGIRMVVKALRHQNDSTQKHGPAPELRQYIALNTNMPDIFRVGLSGDRRNYFSE